MAPRQRSDRIYARIPMPLKRKLDAHMIANNKSMSQIVRDALEAHLGESGQHPREDEFIVQLKRATNRMCGLLVKVLIDVSVMTTFLYRGLDDRGKEIYNDAYENAVRRLRSRLTPDEEQIKDRMAG